MEPVTINSVEQALLSAIDAADEVLTSALDESAGRKVVQAAKASLAQSQEALYMFRKSL